MNTDPVPTTTGVWLPMALADRLLACYYGGAPRHPSAREVSPPAPVAAPTEPTLQERLEGLVPQPQWRPPIPRGINARKITHPDTPLQE
jgi:hypothetical protein